MLNKEVANYAYRAIIDYLGGRQEEFLRLTSIAQKLNGEMTCGNCGGVQIPCKIKNVRKELHGYICTECRQIIFEGRVYRPGVRRQLA